MNQPVLPSPSDEEHMLSHGFYNKHSHEQGKANTCGLPLIIEAINQIDLQQIGSEFRIADYGSAQGQNSLLPMKTAIAQVKALATKAGRTETPVTVTHTAFLQYRTLEMQPSARLLIVGSGANQQGNSGAEGLIDLANAVLQQLVKDGELDPEEYEEMAIPTYYRTAQEWKEPFTSDSNFPLSLDHFEEFALPDVYLEHFQHDGDAQVFAEAYAGFFKAAFVPCLFVGRSDKRTSESRQQVIDLFSQKLQSALAQDPKRYSCRWVIHLMLISKKEK